MSRVKATHKTRTQLIDELDDLRRQLAESQEAERRQGREDESLRAIVAGTASATGDDFFRSLVSNLAGVLRVRYAFVSEFVEKPKRVRTLAFWTGEGFLDNFEYDLADTPCEKVLNGEACHYPVGVQALFPMDKDLMTLNAESYLAIPLIDQPGNVLGHLAVIHDGPMHVEDMSMFKIFGSRAGSELERKQAEKSLEHELKVAQALLEEAQQRVEAPLLGESPTVRGLRAAISRFADTDRTLLLTGSCGVGHEAAARAIHHQSKRSKRAFIHVRCAVLEMSDGPSLFESGLQLATSDNSPKIGRFNLADGGTLYLDDVDALSVDMQEQLSQVLQKLDSDRDGGQKPRPDVRVIASTSRELGAQNQDLRFNPMLHQLLSHGQLTIPGLAERREDIPVLVKHFATQQARRLGKSVHLTDESMKRLEAYRWPGNIRELENVIERAIAAADTPRVEIDESFLEGGITLDRYRLLKKLGAGGMGEVWLAKHQMLARPAALKVIRSEVLDNANMRDSAIRRFRREAQITATLTSPNTVRLYDFGVSDTGSFYFAMELLNGLDLESMVKRFGPMLPERVVMLLRQSCRSLGEAHRTGLVHRDIKPANLFACRMGREYDFLKVLDFGVVKRELGGRGTKLTATGGVAGTPAYMAPELILGEAGVDCRADLYALGCVAYWMLTGTLVFESDNALRLMMRHVDEMPSPPSRVSEFKVPKILDEIVLACLEKSPADRPGSADEVWEALGQVDLSNPWTEERAESWWQSHMPDLTNSDRTCQVTTLASTCDGLIDGGRVRDSAGLPAH